MIPAAFEYHAPASLADATALLAKLGDDAKVLSGGQSLIPLMKLRLAKPRHVVNDPICGMTVDVATARHRSDVGGRAVYFCCLACKGTFDRG